MYRQFNIHQFYVLPTQCIYVFCLWISEQTAIISLYSINWLVFITETESVYCAVRTESFTCNSGWIQSSKRFSAARFWWRRKRITLMYFIPHRRRPRSIRFCYTECNFISTFEANKPSDLVWTLFTATHSRATGRNLMQSVANSNHTRGHTHTHIHTQKHMYTHIYIYPTGGKEKIYNFRWEIMQHFHPKI